MQVVKFVYLLRLNQYNACKINKYGQAMNEFNRDPFRYNPDEEAELEVLRNQVKSQRRELLSLKVQLFKMRVKCIALDIENACLKLQNAYLTFRVNQLTKRRESYERRFYA